MVFIIDKILNFLIYIFLIHFCWRIDFRKNKLLVVLSAVLCIIAGALDAYFGDTHLIIYLLWCIASMLLLFDNKLWHTALLTLGLTWFMGMIDTFSLIIVQILLFGGARDRDVLESWQLLAYIISFSLEYTWYRLLLKRNSVYMDNMSVLSKVTILLMTLVFETVVVNVFGTYYKNPEEYTGYLHLRFALCLIGTIYAISITLKLAIQIYLYNQQTKQLRLALDMQQNQYIYQKENNLHLRKFRHDLINHIGVLQEYLSNKQYDNAKEYIDSIWKIAENMTNKINTGDDYFDAILNYYYYLCEKKDVFFEVSGKFHCPMEMDMVDVTTLIGNAVQNALEATMEVDNKIIKVEIIDHFDEAFITVINTCTKRQIPTDMKLKTSKLDKDNHGFGLNNIISVVEKYSGEYYLSLDEGKGKNVFRLDISLPRGGKQ